MAGWTVSGGRRLGRWPRGAAALSAGLLALPPLAGCSLLANEPAEGDAAVQALAAVARDGLREGGGVTWGVDRLPATLNAFQQEADPVTDRVAQAVLPHLFTLDAAGTPEANPDYLVGVEASDGDPEFEVRYTLHPEARWSDGTPLAAADFVAQWQALGGADSAFWSARNAGYDRIEAVAEGEEEGEVVVTFSEPYADWESLFTPLYPRAVTDDPDAFNTGSRDALPVSGGPFELRALDRDRGRLALVPNDAWWGDPALLETLVFAEVPREDRLAAMASGDLQVAEVDPSDADRIDAAAEPGSAPAVPEAEPDADEAEPDVDGAEPDEAPAGAARDGADVDEAPAGAERDKAEPDADPDEPDAGPASQAPEAGAEEPAAEAPDAEVPGTDPATEEDGVGGGAAPAAPPSAGAALLDLAEARIAAGPAAEAGQDTGTAAAAEEYAAAVAAEQRARDAAFAAREDTVTQRLSGYTVHRAYAPSYTQLALNGTSAALADERVRWALARALDRTEIAAAVHEPAGLPARPAGHHLWVHGQEEYRDNSGELGATGAASAAEQLDTAGWYAGPGGAHHVASEDDTADPDPDGTEPGAAAPQPAAAPATVPVRLGAAVPAATQRASVLRLAATVAGEVSRDGAYDQLSEPAEETAAAAAAAEREAAELVEGSAAAVRVRQGTPLQLRFVLPDEGPGADELRTVGDRIVRMLADVGVDARIDEVPYEEYFTDHVAEGAFDLALYAWPATAWPATDARPVFAKPQSVPGGGLFVEQNYSRVGTDHIDQLLDQAGAELDDGRRAELLNDADVRIWGAAGSVPLYQSPELVAADRDLAGVGAFGLETPRFQDIGYRAD